MVVDLWSFLFLMLTLGASWNHVIFRKNSLVKSTLCHGMHLTSTLICVLMNNLIDNTNTYISIKSRLSHVIHSCFDMFRSSDLPWGVLHQTSIYNFNICTMHLYYLCNEPTNAQLFNNKEQYNKLSVSCAFAGSLCKIFVKCRWIMK